MKLLLVEDSVQLNKALSTVLKRNSFVVDSAFDGEEALILLKDYQYDVVILDIMLPKIDGIEVLKKARASGIQTPIIMLTAKSTTDDKILGLDAGADDYLSKPFVVEELLARIRALTRRKPVYEKNESLSFGDLSLDLSNNNLCCGKKSVLLMNKELQIMSLLMKNGESITSSDVISKSAWDIDAFSTSENVWVFISYLRKKLVSIDSKVNIKSIRQQGYFLEYKK